MEVSQLIEFLNEQNLYEAKLSPINSLGKISKSFIGLLLELGTNFYFIAARSQVSDDVIQATALKRHTLEGNKKKRDVSKRSKTSRPQVEAPKVATRSSIPLVTIIDLKNTDPNDEVEVILTPSTITAPLTTILASRAAMMVVSSLDCPLGMTGWVPTTTGPVVAPPSSLGSRVSRGFGPRWGHDIIGPTRGQDIKEGSQALDFHVPEQSR